MSHSTSATSNSSLNYEFIFLNAIEAYRKKTGNDLRSHPLLAKLETCDSPDAVLTALREQITGFDQSGSSDDKFTRWLDPTVNVLYALSSTIGGGVSLVYPPAGVIFSGIGILLSVANASRSNQDALLGVFERIENFFRRLETYTEVPPDTGMTGTIVKIMVEVLSILAIVTKAIKQNKAKTFLKRLAGRRDIEDALQRLDKLTQGEALMVVAQGLKATKVVDGNVARVGNDVQGISDKIQDVDTSVKEIGEKTVESVEKLRQDIAKEFGLRDAVPNGFEAAQSVLEYGENVDARNYREEAPLYDIFRFRRSGGDPRPVRPFLEYGADMDTRDRNHWTLLHVMSYHGYPGPVQVLLEQGANADVRDNKGRTPLHVSIKGFEPYHKDTYFDVMRVLIAHGADVNAQDVDRSTPLHLIAARGGLEITRLLLDHGADANVRNNQGKVPCDIAADNSSLSLTRLLSEHTLERGTALTA